MIKCRMSRWFGFSEEILTSSSLVPNLSISKVIKQSKVVVFLLRFSYQF